MKKRINKIIDLLKKDQPVYYVSTSNFTYKNGKKFAKTWADFIRLDTEHSSSNWDGIADFMRGLKDGGPTKSGHQSPAVIAELPFKGINKQNVISNSWIIHQLLAKGVHGLILCHANSEEAVKEFVAACRYPFNKIGVGKKLPVGTRGHGGQILGSKIWSISEDEYLKKADPWPLNPNGELVLGIKLENKTAIKNAHKTTKVPGLCVGDYGLGDISFSMGFTKPIRFPLPKKIISIREKVWKICEKSKIHFWGQVNEETIIKLIKRGIRFCRVYDKKIAFKGMRFTKRSKPW
jgi:4-hydroxy-2-oxoheptanedioate aldolase